MSTMTARTYQPPEDTAQVRSLLAAAQQRRDQPCAPRYLLIGDGDDEPIELPETVYRVLVQVVEALAAGKAVTVTPGEPQLTTQQAADLLGVSRPTVVRLIGSGELSAERHGHRRRLALGDVLAYREHRRRRQYAMLDATAVGFDAEDDPAIVTQRLREAREAVAAGRTLPEPTSPETD